MAVAVTAAVCSRVIIMTSARVVSFLFVTIAIVGSAAAQTPVPAPARPFVMAQPRSQPWPQPGAQPVAQLAPQQEPQPAPRLAPRLPFVLNDAPHPPMPPSSHAPGSVTFPFVHPHLWQGSYTGRAGSEENRYQQARQAIEENRYEKALEMLDLVVSMKGTQADAAMYWKAYSQTRLSRSADALATLAALQKQFSKSRWLNDARALELEVRQASGQAVSADAQNDDLKLLALRSLLQSDADAALPVIEKLLAGTSSPRVKEQALFVLSQSNSPKARTLIAGIARGGGNPEIQMRAIRYLGLVGGTESRDTLEQVYRTSSDLAVKRLILRGLMTAGYQAQLLALARNESSEELRGEAAQQLGAMGASTELETLYKSEMSIEVKKRILQALALGGRTEMLGTVARTEQNMDLRRQAVRALGMAGGAEETLLSIYRGDAPPEIRTAVIDGLFMQRSGRALVDLARNEKDPARKRTIVERLSRMPSPEAREYMMELLK